MTLEVFVCDNYDSFTFNLVQYLGEAGAVPRVVRNDVLMVEEIAGLAPGAVVISPGPGRPQDAGVSVELVRWCATSSTPLLGVCLGHQAIAEAFGARVVRAPSLMHGKTSMIAHDAKDILAGLPNPFEAMRYHSLAIEESSLPSDLEVTARTTDGVVMGIRHVSSPIFGVQFHPESIGTVYGMTVIENFVRAAISAIRIGRR